MRSITACAVPAQLCPLILAGPAEGFRPRLPARRKQGCFVPSACYKDWGRGAIAQR